MAAESHSETVLNGSSPRSNTVRHLLTLPAVQEGYRAVSANPIGKMSIQLTSSAFNMVAAPLAGLFEKPLFEKPLSYVTPYAQRVDQLGDQAVTKIVEKYPVVKSPAPELVQAARDVALKPVRHVGMVYNRAYEESTGKPPIASGKAAVKTAVALSAGTTIIALREALRVAESFQITDTLRAGLDQVEHTINEAFTDPGLNGAHNGDTQHQNAQNQNGQAQAQAQQNHNPAGDQSAAGQTKGSDAQPAAK